MPAANARSASRPSRRPACESTCPGWWQGWNARTGGRWPNGRATPPPRACTGCCAAWTGMSTVRDDIRDYVIERLGDPRGAYGQAKYLQAWLEDQDVSHVLAIRRSDTLSTASGEQRADTLSSPPRPPGPGSGCPPDLEQRPARIQVARIPVRTAARRPARGHWLLGRAYLDGRSRWRCSADCGRTTWSGTTGEQLPAGRLTPPARTGRERLPAGQRAPDLRDGLFRPEQFTDKQWSSFITVRRSRGSGRRGPEPRRLQQRGHRQPDYVRELLRDLDQPRRKAGMITMSPRAAAISRPRRSCVVGGGGSAISMRAETTGPGEEVSTGPRRPTAPAWAGSRPGLPR